MKLIHKEGVSQMMDEQALEHAVSGFASALQASSISIPVPLFTLYRQLGLNETEMMVLLQLITFQQHERNELPSMDQIQARMSLSSDELMSVVHQLIKMNWIKLDSVMDPQSGQELDCYNLQPFWERLAQAWMMQSMKRQQQAQQLAQNKSSAYSTGGFQAAYAQQPPAQPTIFSFFEEEFARPLSPMECETITQWQTQDQLSDSMILAALREAVFANKVHFAYIDKVLMDWKSKHLKTLEDVKRYQQQFRNAQRG
jgi:DNA replication protein